MDTPYYDTPLFSTQRLHLCSTMNANRWSCPDRFNKCESHAKFLIFTFPRPPQCVEQIPLHSSDRIRRRRSETKVGDGDRVRAGELDDPNSEIGPPGENVKVRIELARSKKNAYDHLKPHNIKEYRVGESRRCTVHYMEPPEYINRGVGTRHRNTRSLVLGGRELFSAAIEAFSVPKNLVCVCAD